MTEWRAIKTEDLSLKEIMSYELGPVPPALLEARNVFWKADKQQLASVIRVIMQGMPF